MALPFILEILNKVRRIKLEPIGVVRPWPGNTPPLNWVECDGAALESSDYPLLFAVIGTRFGDGTTGLGATGSTDFNLPDLRGRFIRGYDAGSGNDPDAATRGDNTAAGGTSIAGQATGDNIGSIQGDTLGPHSHEFPGNPAEAHVNIGGGVWHDSTNTSITGTTGGTDTRPKNLNFMYIIRV